MKILKVNKPSDYSSYIGVTDRHPLVSVIEYDRISPVPTTLNDYKVYGIFLRGDSLVDLTYGCGLYDYKEGTLLAVAPGQIGGAEDNGEKINLSGWSLMFHPDLLQGTPLKKNIDKYTFFEYSLNEALHMTEEERDIIIGIMRSIETEINKPRDSHQDNIIVNYIELMLNFCQRFYDRQFLTRKLENTDILSRFHEVLKEYYSSELQMKHGIPTLQYLAERLCLSPNYLGDLIKRTTGTNASKYIQRIIIQEAKNLLSSGQNISQTAYSLGFDYPQHFTRFFKREEGITPKEYLKHRK
ncbi:MAG: helix-turn-helix domain-containing protein, partial [Muribaculaceae bacterium]|nr:helix-turn-helix domain-containing protein [Muribaculaceae bacterium]